jgi:hypothetical protein
MQFLARHHEPIDISLGGVRIFSDDKMRVGELLKMEFFLPDVEPVTYTAEVVWIEPLPAGSPARFDVGLKFIQLEPGAINLLMGVLGPPEELEGDGDGDGEEGEEAAPPAEHTEPTGKLSGTGR